MLIILCSAASADVPRLINYQGRLTDADGVPVPDGNYSLTFRIFAACDAASSIWSEEELLVEVTDGLFSVVLGEVIHFPEALADTPDLCLEIQVGTAEPMAPRTQLVSHLFAFRSETSDSALVIADNCVTSSKIDDGTISFQDIAQNGASPNQIMKWDGSAWVASDDMGGGAEGWADDGTLVRLTTPEDSVGIGTSTPIEKLDVTGNIHVTGKAAIGPNCTNTGANSFVAGLDNVASGVASTVSGGYSNTASGTNQPTISGGARNTAGGSYATISGGADNIASGYGATVGGGFQNIAAAESATVGGGHFNFARGAFSTVAGGGGAVAADSNAALGDYSAIGGGQSNLVEGNYSVVSGGYSNQIAASADYSYLFGIGSSLDADSTFMVDMPHIRFGDEATGYEVPTEDGTAGQVMATDGNGQLSWADPGVGSVGGEYHRVIEDATSGTASSTLWTTLATLDIPAGEISSYITITSHVSGYGIHREVSPIGSGYGQLRITIDDVEQISCVPAQGSAVLGGTVSALASETFMSHTYAPTVGQKQNGFVVTIEGRYVGSVAASAGHIRTDIWGL
jgi:hypothetical protein